MRPTSGEANFTALMGDLSYDSAMEPVEPYLGLGIGAVNVSFEDVRDADGLLFDGSKTVFASQFIGGVGFSLLPSTTLYIDTGRW